MTICYNVYRTVIAIPFCRSSEIFATETKRLAPFKTHLDDDSRILGLRISRKSIRSRDEKSIKKLRQARVTLQREDYVRRRIRFLSNFN